MANVVSRKNVAVIGCGYVGYPLALLLADAGHGVQAIDTDPRVVAAINAGENANHEPSLGDLAARIKKSGRLTAKEAPGRAEVFIISVPTPLDASAQTADLSHVRDAAASVLPHLEEGNLVVVESTVPPGTCVDIVLPILERSGLRAGKGFYLAHCPERVYPGNTLHEMTHVERIVGGVDPESTGVATEFYGTFVSGLITSTDATTAEVCKLMENTYRDTNIALANEVASIADRVGVDPSAAIRIANQHPRVQFLDPGIGVGGHCIPVDPLFLKAGIAEAGIIEAARAVNDRQPGKVAEAIMKYLDPDTRSLLLLGAAYKTEVSDTRSAPASEIKRLLQYRGYKVDVFDPHIPEYANLPTTTEIAVLLVAHRRLLKFADELAGSGIHVLDVTTGIPRAWSPSDD